MITALDYQPLPVLRLFPVTSPLLVVVRRPFPSMISSRAGAGGRPGAQLKLGLTKTMINIARQLSHSFVGIYH